MKKSIYNLIWYGLFAGGVLVASHYGQSFVGGWFSGPKAVIVGPANVPLGKLVHLSAEGSVGSTAWVVLTPGADIVPGAKKDLWFVGPVGSYQVMLIATKGTTDAKSHTLTIGDAPPPGPDPKPGPVFPPSKFDLSKFAYDAALANVKGDASLRAADAQKLAKSLASIQAAIAAGTLGVPADILAATKAANHELLGTRVADWQDFSQALNDRLKALFNAGQLKEPNDYKTAWNELELGLKEVK